MGEIRKYSCTCGYEEELCVGSGMNAINFAFVEQLFPEEYEELAKKKEAGENISFQLSNIIGNCQICKKLHAIAALRYTLPDGKVTTVRKKCPICDVDVAVQTDEDHIRCPKCGQMMTWQHAGLWD